MDLPASAVVSWVAGQGTQFLSCRKRQNPAFISVESGLSDELGCNDPSLLCETIGQRNIAHLIDKTRIASRQPMHQGTGLIRKQ
jgi:hypothetical protein